MQIMSQHFFIQPGKFSHMNKSIILILLVILSGPLLGQEHINGRILGQVAADQKAETLEAARIFWLNTTVGTLTDKKGNFKIEVPENLTDKKLVLIASGYAKDTLEITDMEAAFQGGLEITLMAYSTDEVTINSRNKGIRISRLDPIKTEFIGEVELAKAACCNLSESFETSGTVDVSFADAITGAKRIMMLGLDGVYTQILAESYPAIRGLATTFGLTAIPGPWMQSIQVSKGAASVQNGYESLTGEINVEYKKPQNADRMFLNLYANQMGRVEGSLNLSHRFSSRLSTMLFVHGNSFQRVIDPNGDGFRDMPALGQYSFFNRWRWHSGKSWRGQFGVKYFEESRLGGQIQFDPEQDRGSNNAYGIEINTKRWEAFNKAGYVISGKPDASIGTQVTFSNHHQESFFGMNTYRGEQTSLFAKGLFSTIVDNSNHKLTSGLSFQYDNYREAYNDSSFSRLEKVPGAFAEYTYNRLNRLIIVAGFRADYHNLYGMIYTPRAHMKYDLDPKTTLRASIGSGFRVANVFAEYLPAMMSSREVIIRETLNPEKGWNYGFNLTRYFSLLEREGNISLDVYRTDFENQIVANRETSGKLFFQNLDGRSFGNYVQIETYYEPVDRLEVRLAWKWNQVKSTFDDQLLAVPFVVGNRGLFNVGYVTGGERWQFDATLQYIGRRRLPNSAALPLDLQLPDESPAYIQVSGQVTHKFKNLDVYLGGENLTGFIQEDPIIAASEPFGEHFDAAMTWGPIIGRRIYIGIRLPIAGKQPVGF